MAGVKSRSFGLFSLNLVRCPPKILKENEVNMDFHITLSWTRSSHGFDYETFNRSHFITFGGGTTLEASAAPNYFGKKEHPNPEEVLLASVASCHMLTFLAIAAKSRLTVEDYRDEPEAEMDRNEAGKTWVKKITLRPRAVFSGEKIPDREKILRLHQSAHRNCFISNSLRTEILLDPIY